MGADAVRPFLSCYDSNMYSKNLYISPISVGPHNAKMRLRAYVDSEGPDPRSLIRAFTVRLQNDWILQRVWMESKGPRAVWSGPSLSAYWMIGYYRVYEWRAKAPAQSDQGLHCPLTEWLDTTECTNGEQRPPRSLIRAFTVRLQNDWILQSVRMESKGPRTVWSGPSLSDYRMIGYYRVYEWRAKAPAQSDQGLHCPLTEWLATRECTNGEQRTPVQSDQGLHCPVTEWLATRECMHGEQRPPAQSDQGLHCPLTEWLDTTECTNREQRPPRSRIRAFTVRLQNDWQLESVWMES